MKLKRTIMSLAFLVGLVACNSQNDSAKDQPQPKEEAPAPELVSRDTVETESEAPQMLVSRLKLDENGKEVPGTVETVAFEKAPEMELTAENMDELFSSESSRTVNVLASDEMDEETATEQCYGGGCASRCGGGYAGGRCGGGYVGGRCGSVGYVGGGCGGGGYGGGGYGGGAWWGGMGGYSNYNGGYASYYQPVQRLYTQGYSYTTWGMHSAYRQTYNQWRTDRDYGRGPIATPYGPGYGGGSYGGGYGGGSYGGGFGGGYGGGYGGGSWGGGGMGGGMGGPVPTPYGGGMGGGMGGY